MENTATIICINYYPRTISEEFATIGILGINNSDNRVVYKYCDSDPKCYYRILNFFDIKYEDLLRVIGHSMNDISILLHDKDYLTQLLTHTKNSPIRYQLHCVSMFQDNESIDDLVYNKYNELIVTRH